MRKVGHLLKFILKLKQIIVWENSSSLLANCCSDSHYLELEESWTYRDQLC